MKNQYAVRTIVCQSCGKTVTKRMPAGRRYCSHECYRHADHPQRKNGVDVVCELCGKSFYLPKNRIEKASHYFCCLEHANEWQGRNKTEHACKVCGKTFRWSPSRSASGNHNITYCSLECRDKDPERTAMLLRMNSAQQKLNPNKLEQAGFAILDSIGVEYIKQYTIGGKFIVDAFVPSANLAVQFDGEYWHGHPSKYNPNDKRQQRRINLDRSQDAYMRQCGITVIRFWESDVLRNQSHVTQSLISAIHP